MPTGAPSAEDVRAALEELLGWQGISRSPQLAELLRYVVEKTLAGEGAAIKAYAIAVDVLGRPADFDPQTDPIVRVQAKRLRNLLEQYYASGIGTSGVEIHLPLGRYVPEFREAERETAAVDAPAPPAGNGRRAPSLSSFLGNAMLALIFTLVGVLLTVVILRYMMPLISPPPALPQVPGVMVGSFDNLTGQPVLDDDVRDVGSQLTSGLKAFDMIEVGRNDFRVIGNVQLVQGQFVLRASVTEASSGTPQWSTIIEAPRGMTDTEALKAAASKLAAQIGNATGPLHQRGRAWLRLQERPPQQPNAYVCELLHMIWRENRQLDAADAALSCFVSVREKGPEDALLLAAAADIASWRAKYLAAPQDDIAAALSNAASAVGRAVTLAPNSSFVYEQQASILARQGSIDAALGALGKALELNPANLDAFALRSHLLWLSGQFEEGVADGERALTALPSPPNWYYLTRALSALRQDRFFDAIDAAQALGTGDEEFSSIIALTAAPRAARVDLIDRYRPRILDNPYFQAAGIMPRLGMRLNTSGVLQKIRAGLVLAGLPVNALDRPFNADGSERIGR